MNVAFYAPLKSPDHPVPSGDRLMAQLIIEAMQTVGHQVTIASHLRSFTKVPDGPAVFAIQQAAREENQRLDRLFEQADQRPDLWFCYHPYYKSPDLIGPALCRTYDIPYITMEASHSKRRDVAGWSALQDHVREAIALADSNICLTKRDAEGLRQANANLVVDQINPFLKTGSFEARPAAFDATQKRLVAIAMMRPGDKVESYRHLSKALSLIKHQNWHLDIVGDGPARGVVEALFSRFGTEQVTFHGALPPEKVRDTLASASLYVWPGVGEAYGLAYLEAQAMGVPVVAYDIAGVAEVVNQQTGGSLVRPLDPDHYAQMVQDLLSNHEDRARRAKRAREAVFKSYSFSAAAERLDAILKAVIENRSRDKLSL